MYWTLQKLGENVFHEVFLFEAYVVTINIIFLFNILLVMIFVYRTPEVLGEF